MTADAKLSRQLAPFAAMALTFLTLALLHTPLRAQQSLAQYDPDALARLVQQWLDAPHADHDSLSFTYWNKQGAVPVECAACHSQPGFLDHLGADGTPAGVVDHPAAINQPIGCASCHTDSAHALDRVTFPSGVDVAGMGSSALCATCHQGRLSGLDVARATETLPEDQVQADLGFMNIHYAAAAGVQGGRDLIAGYHYPGQSYAGTFTHVPSAGTCIACHDPHSTRVESDGCLSCHRGVDDLRAIRMQHGDFDGDGSIAGGIMSEIAGLQTQLLDAIRIYAVQVASQPVAYAPGQYPYFFKDPDGDGQIGADEGGFPNRYQSWTPRLLKAAYNYQLSRKDPGAYVHNPRYMLQLLHDSLADLAGAIDLDLGRRPRP